jgi:acetylornithine deacetylase/succinyl-diaminopimelate desuccinylase-like protein
MAFFAKDVPSLCYGLRGIAYMQLDLQRPNRDLHSGSYGGSVHNPIQALSEIIAQLHDRDGRVTIGGFYYAPYGSGDQPLSERCKKGLSEISSQGIRAEARRTALRL